MKYGTHCKFCDRPISPEMDEEYLKLGRDPLGLLAMACCDHCGGVREWRWSLEGAIKLAADRIFYAGKMSDEARKAHWKGMEELTKKYAKMIARWHFVQGECWDEMVVEAMLAEPRKWGEHLNRLWKMFRHWQKSQEQQEFPGQ